LTRGAEDSPALPVHRLTVHGKALSRGIGAKPFRRSQCEFMVLMEVARIESSYLVENVTMKEAHGRNQEVFTTDEIVKDLTLIICTSRIV
jgi:hypothetical protein